MPKVQEYLPELEAQGPVGQTSPMLEEATQFGRGVEEAGRSISDAYSVIRQRQTAAESSDAYASVAEQRANMMIRIQQETNDGTLNIDKIKKDQQDWFDKQSDIYSTAGGKDAFNRSAARMQGSVLQHAAIGQTVVAGNRAKQNLSSMINNDSNTVMSDPTQFGDLRDNQTEFIQRQVEAGAISPAVAVQLQKATDLEMSKAAVRGFMQSDYNNIKTSVVNTGGKVDPNTLSLNAARQMLDGGHFDSYMDSDTKKAMYQEIRANQAAAQTAGMQAINQKRMAVDAEGEAFKGESYVKLQNNALSPDAVTAAFRKGIITSDEQLKMYHLIDQAGKDEMKTNPAMKNEVMQRILSPDNTPGHVSDPMQIANMVGPGMLTHSDFHELSNAIQMNPKNRVDRFNEQKMIQDAKTSIGSNDPDAQYKLMMFTNEIQQAKQKAMQENKPIGSLFDPKSKEYIGNQVQKYVVTPQQALSQEADRIRGGSVASTTVQTAPGVTPTSSSGPKTNEISTMDLKGLSSLNPKILSPDQREAARIRYNQLHKAKK